MHSLLMHTHTHSHTEEHMYMAIYDYFKHCEYVLIFGLAHYINVFLI